MHVVAHQDHGAVVGGQRLDQRLAGFDVEVVGGLVEDEEMGGVEGREEERQARLLAAGEAADLGFRLRGLEAEAGEAGPEFRLVVVGRRRWRCWRGVSSIWSSST
jgi:hypothetical protein